MISSNNTTLFYGHNHQKQLKPFIGYLITFACGFVNRNILKTI